MPSLVLVTRPSFDHNCLMRGPLVLETRCASATDTLTLVLEIRSAGATDTLTVVLMTRRSERKAQ